MKLLAGCMVLFGMVALGFGEMRTWTSRSGQTIEAEYVRDTMGKVWLKSATGKVKKVPISGLSKSDQDYINNKILPKITISVDDDIARGTVGSDIDNVRQTIRCEVKISKTSRRPYSGELTVYFFVFGWDLMNEEYMLMDTKKETFTLTSENNNKYTLTGDKLRFEYDPSPPWGDRYEGYLVCVKTSDGKILATKGNSKYERKLHVFIKARKGARFDEDMMEL